jgi:hypothetical protein
VKFKGKAGISVYSIEELLAATKLKALSTRDVKEGIYSTLTGS